MNNNNSDNSMQTTQNSNLTNTSTVPVQPTTVVPNATTTANVVPTTATNNVPVANVVPTPTTNATPAANVVPTPTVVPQTSNNTLQTIVVPSGLPEEDSIVTTNDSNLNMPAIVNPLEVKPDEVKEEVKTENNSALESKDVNNEQANQDNQDNQEFVNEKLKKVEVDYKPPSKVQTATTIFIFVIFILFVIFLPDISTYINLRKSGTNNTYVEPTTGKLICTLESNTSNLDKTFSREFKYEDNKLKSAVIETITRGDVTLDEATLDGLYDKCNQISKGVESLDGVTITCEYKDGLLTERERFDYKSYDRALTSAAYVEAGSNVLEFDYDTDIDVIMKQMRQSGFTCKKEK